MPNFPLWPDRASGIATQVDTIFLFGLGITVFFSTLIFMFLWGAKIYFNIARPPSDAVEFTVVGKQWMWKIQHPEGRREINELHVPVGVPIKLTMTSEDVVHSFF